MKRTLILAAAMLHVAAALAQSSRVTFVRRVAPVHDLSPAERLAVIYAIGDSDKIHTFIERFVDSISKSETLHVEDAVESNHSFVLDGRELRRLRHDHPADAYLGVRRFTCSGEEKTAEGSERDVGGNRVKRLHHWVDARCQGRVEVLNGNGRPLFSYSVRGDGTSPRSVALTSDERDVAYDQAARYAAVTAAEEISPRFVRESIELDDTAPAFEEGFSMVRSERLDDARAIWEAAAQRHRDSAALFYDLGAVCEAGGDLPAAHRYYERAVRLSPRERRYSVELDLFNRRNASAMARK